MAVKIGEAIVSFGSYEGKDGKKHAKNETIGEIMQHSDGRLFIKAKRSFCPAVLPAKEGSDSYFIGLNIPDAKVVTTKREPGTEG